MFDRIVKVVGLGKLCPLCKKGIIVYKKWNVWDTIFETWDDHESVGCSNPKCRAYYERV